MTIDRIEEPEVGNTFRARTNLCVNHLTRSVLKELQHSRRGIWELQDPVSNAPISENRKSYKIHGVVESKMLQQCGVGKYTHDGFLLSFAECRKMTLK